MSRILENVTIFGTGSGQVIGLTGGYMSVNNSIHIGYDYNGYSIYQYGTQSNYYAGRSLFGTSSDDGTSIVQIAGTLSILGIKVKNMATYSTGPYSVVVHNTTTGNLELVSSTSGPQGFTGSQGAIGPQGFTGSQGAIGPQGFTGNQGAIGPQGFTGSTGSQGPQGSAGAIGSTAAYYVNSGNLFGATASIGTNDGFNFTLRTNGITALIISSASQNIGIGATADSSYKLKVQGSASVTGNLTLQSTLTDKVLSVGTAGYVLSAIAGGVQWIPYTTATLYNIAYATNMTFTGSNGTLQGITLSGGAYLSLSGLSTGVDYHLNVAQDATGNRGLTWSTTVKVAYGGAGSVPISTAGGAIDRYTIFYDGTSYFVDYSLFYS